LIIKSSLFQDASSAISVPHMSTASRTPNRKVDSLLEEKTLSSTRNTVFLTTTTFPDLFWDNKSRFKTAMEALRVERLSTLYKQCQMSVENFHGFSDKPNPWALHSKQYKVSRNRSVGAGKLSGVLRIFARISPNSPKKLLGYFLCEY